jgi:hypothetical protein
MRYLVLGLAAGIALTASAGICEQPSDTSLGFPPATLASRQFALMAHGGLYTPLGLGGVTIEYAALPWLVAAAGAGTNANALELTAGGKLRLMMADRTVTGVGFGFGYGQPYSSCWVPLAAPRCALPDAAPNAHAEIYFETRPTPTLVSRVYAGMLNSVLLGHQPSSDTVGLVPYLGVAFGTVF